MVKAPHTIYQSQAISPETGLTYDVVTTVAPNACRDCGGTGEIRFSTFADLRKFVLEQRLMEEDPEYYEDYDHRPEVSGTRQCERCYATGVFEGDRGLFTVSMSYSGSIPFAPH